MEIRTLDDFNFKDKTVLVRIDINSEIRNGKPSLSDRFIASLKTIRELKRKKAKIVLLAHQGRPGKPEFTNLRKHAKLLSKYIKLRFVNDVIGVRAVKAIRSLKPGEVLLLDNIRGLKEEFKPSIKNKIVRTLAPLADYYVNDAFSNSHREHTSIVSFPKVLPSCAGRLLEKELRGLENVNVKNCLFILAGSKPEDNILLMKNKNIITGGIFGHLCLIAKGYYLGAQNDFLKDKLKYISKLKKYVKHVKTPVDLAVRTKGDKRKDLKIEDFPSEFEVFDIGPETVKKYVPIIKKAKSIFLKGTLGYCEEKKFSKGTKAIFKAILSSNAFSIVGGGHTTTAFKRLKLNPNKLGHISLSGGALIRYLAGEKLPGLEALKKCSM